MKFDVQKEELLGETVQNPPSLTCGRSTSRSFPGLVTLEEAEKEEEQRVSVICSPDVWCPSLSDLEEKRLWGPYILGMVVV